MKIRYQADNDLDQRIIDAVTRLVPEIEFKTSPETGFHTGMPDPDILRIVAEEGRVLISHDLKTMPLKTSHGYHSPVASSGSA